MYLEFYDIICAFSFLLSFRCDWFRAKGMNEECMGLEVTVVVFYSNFSSSLCCKLYRHDLIKEQNVLLLMVAVFLLCARACVCGLYMHARVCVCGLCMCVCACVCVCMCVCVVLSPRLLQSSCQ